MSEILIRGGDVVTMVTPGEVIENADVVISGDRLRAVGPSGRTAPSGWQPHRVIDARGKAVLPGFVNTHNHAAMTLLRGYADDLRLQEWLEQRIWPAEARFTPADIGWGTRLAAVEMIRSGITGFADMYFEMDQVARAVDEAGMRASLSVGLIGLNPTAGEGLVRSEAFYRAWHGGAEGRIDVMLGPHAPYTCPPEFVAKVLHLATRLEAPLHIHLAETAREIEDSLRDHGQTPVARMAAEGLFQHRVLAAHCVHLTEADIEILAAHGVGVAHNPVSNQKLASGIAPVVALLQAGVAVGLGTDGAASTNHLNMFEEMRAASLIQKVATGDPTAMPAAQVLSMATAGGAAALGWREVGVLEPGRLADLIIVDLDRPHLCPRHDLHSLLVYSARPEDVDTVIINGRLVMEGRELLTLDEEKIMAEVRERSPRLAGTSDRPGVFPEAGE